MTPVEMHTHTIGIRYSVILAGAIGGADLNRERLCVDGDLRLFGHLADLPARLPTPSEALEHGAPALSRNREKESPGGLGLEEESNERLRHRGIDGEPSTLAEIGRAHV